MLARRIAAGAATVLLITFASATPAQNPSAPVPEMRKLYQELFAASQKDKRGLTFHVNGQSIPGVVTKVIGNEAVEVRNQSHGRIVIRMDRIDAIAAN